MYQRVNQLISRIIRRVVSTLKQNDDELVPTVQVSYQGGAGSSEVIMPYGIAYSAPIGSFGVMFNNLGNTDDRFTFLYKPSNRFKDLKEGEFQIGNQEKGTFVKFSENGDIIIKSEKDVNISVNGIVNLGEGGNNIARVGDTIQVTIPFGSSAGTYQGTIISGGDNKSI